VKTAQQVYAPVTNPRTRAEIFPGLEPGSEMGWGGMAGATPFSISTDYYKYILFNDPAWDFRTLTFDDEIAKSDALDRDGATMNAVDPDLSAFVKRGGKLLLYHGWNDQLIAPMNTVNYYESVLQRMGGPSATSDSIRLFMMPGVTHCAGGDGPSNFDNLAVLEQWVEAKQPPSAIVATHLSGGAVDRSRPLCPYPQVAVYRSTGDTNSATSFSCAVK
jgi:feruloyl esterase